MSVDVFARWQEERLPAARAEVEELAEQVAKARAVRDEAQAALDEVVRLHAYAAHMVAEITRADRDGRAIAAEVPADRAVSAALTPPQDGPEPVRLSFDPDDPTHQDALKVRRGALRKLTDEAIEAGSYGEPAPEMRTPETAALTGPSPCVRGEHARCAGCAECPQSCHPDALSAPPELAKDGRAEVAPHLPGTAHPAVPYALLDGRDVTVHLLDGETVWGRLSDPTPQAFKVGGAEIPVSAVKRVVPDEPMPQPPPPPPSLAALVSKKPITTHLDPIVLPGDLEEGPRHEKPKPEPDTSPSVISRTFRAIVEPLGLIAPKDDGTDTNGEHQ